ncbi:MAG: hypothetical protein N2645_15800 [Clostridia bacterium]|nr:hypothetical protein [Clostridia bacterium]
MIFAADLDGTLIFSKRLFIDIPDGTEIRLIEKKGDEEISFMTQRSIDLLKDINERITFIPVTTRTLEQYTRISIFQNEIKPPYSITSNGGKILVNGKIDPDWDAYIEGCIQKHPLHASAVYEQFIQTFGEAWIRLFRFSDELFWTFLIDETKIPWDKVEEYSRWASLNHWRVSLQGRKLYVVPEFINKWDALEYVKNKLGEKRVIAAGDSLMDYPLIEKADFSYIPPHGELKAQEEKIGKGLPFKYTEKIGIMSGEEILENIKVMIREEQA